MIGIRLNGRKNAIQHETFENAPFRSLRLSAQSLRCIRPAEAGLERFDIFLWLIPAGLMRLYLESRRQRETFFKGLSICRTE